MALLEISELNVHYGKVKAVNGISLEVEEGSMVAIIGANGAGKSSILKAISGLNPATSGEIMIYHQRINDLSPQDIVKKGVAYVPEGRALFPKMTILENLKLGAFLQKNKKSIKQSLDEVYFYFPILKERSNQVAGQLSGGEQQMLAVGRALMANPKLLLLDEPSLGLAPIMVSTIARILIEIKKNGKTILLIEQNAYIALNISDKAYVMESGSIIITDNSDKLLKNEIVKKAYLGG
jgi:branched-chain amino acid transport system ATP-binding protein